MSIDFGTDIYEEPIVAKTFLSEDAQVKFSVNVVDICLCKLQKASAHLFVHNVIFVKQQRIKSFFRRKQALRNPFDTTFYCHGISPSGKIHKIGIANIFFQLFGFSQPPKQSESLKIKVIFLFFRIAFIV